MMPEGCENTTFENKFRDKFRLDLPPPLPISTKNRGFTTDKLWKKRLSFKFAGKTALKFSAKFFNKENELKTPTINSSSAEAIHSPNFPTENFSSSPSPSILSLPTLSATSPVNMSPDIVSSQPLSTSFSVLTISRKPHTLKEEAMHTFKKNGTINYNEALHSDRTSIISDSSQNITPNSSSINVDHNGLLNYKNHTNSSFFNNSNGNFYGQNYENTPRTDYSCRISANSRSSTIAIDNLMTNATSDNEYRGFSYTTPASCCGTLNMNKTLPLQFTPLNATNPRYYTESKQTNLHKLSKLLDPLPNPYHMYANKPMVAVQPLLVEETKAKICKPAVPEKRLMNLKGALNKQIIFQKRKNVEINNNNLLHFDSSLSNIKQCRRKSASEAPSLVETRTVMDLHSLKKMSVKDLVAKFDRTLFIEN